MRYPIKCNKLGKLCKYQIDLDDTRNFTPVPVQPPSIGLDFCCILYKNIFFNFCKHVHVLLY